VLSTAIINFHREEVALSAPSMLSPLLKVQLTVKILGLAQRCALSGTIQLNQSGSLPLARASSA